MRIESITVLIVMLKQILCGMKLNIFIDWEVYVNELGSLAQSNYTNWIDTTTNLPITQMACGTGMTQFIGKGEHDIIRIINMPAKNYNKIQVSFDLYFFGDWSSTSEISVYINNILYQQKTHQQSSTDPAATRMCYDVGGGVGIDFLERIQFEQYLDDSTLNILFRTDKLASEIYGISNFVLLINSLEVENCQTYNISSHDCTRCQDGFTLNDQECICQKFSYYNPGLTCVSQCPVGTTFDNNKFCQPTTQTTLFEDLNIPGFPSYTFDYTPDEKYTQFTGTKILAIDGLNVAGQFWNNDMISYSPINISGPQKIILSFTLYFVGAQSDNSLYKNKYNTVHIGSHIDIYLNNYLMTMINYFDSYSVVVQGNFFRSDYQICTFPLISNCYYYDLQIQFDVVDPIVQLVFKGHFTINNANSFWAIRDLTIKSQLMASILPSCLPPCQTCTSILNYCLTCTTPLLAYDGKCLSTCPDFAPNSGNICVDADLTTNVEYAYTQLYGMQGFDIYTDFTFSPTSLAFPSIFYTNYLSKYTMLGGYQIWNQEQQIIMTKINLPMFHGVRVKFNLLLIDHLHTSGTTFLELGINSSPLISIEDTTAFSNQGNQFGFSDPEYIGEVNQYVSFASTDQLTITLRCMKQATGRNCGIYNLRVYISKCPQYCINCDSTGVCITYINTISTDSSGCKSGYYNDLVKNECTICQVQCLTCTSFSQCTSCIADYELFQNKCFCNKNFAESSSCSSNCKFGCLKCLDGQQCLECDTSLNLWMNVNTCVCQDGYYMENDLKCYECYPTCKTCIKTPRLCMSCDSTQLRHLAYQGCECNDGYFQQDALLTCQSCDPICKTCKLSKSICTSCQLSHFRALSSNKCICANGYYEVGALICEKCPDTCETCSNSSTCLTCKFSQYRQLSILGSKCVCKQSHYESTSTPVCQSCHITCQECQLSSLSTKCTRCPITREPSQGAETFSCKCKKGYYENNTLQCLDCADYINPPSTHYCFSLCGDGIVQWDEDCDDKNQNTRDGCITCLFSNSHCLDDSCTSCHASQCTSCKDGYYLGKDSICYACDSICQKCVTRSDNCTACTLLKPDGSGCLLCQESRGFKIVGDTCLNICGDGIKVTGEKCDDGNTKIGDGCSNTCEVEDGWICDLQCEKIIYPIIQMEENNSDSIYEGIRRIMLTISEPVQITGDLLTNLKIEVFNISSFEISTIDSTNKAEVYQIVKLEIIVTLQEAMPKPILMVTVLNMDSITNQQGFSFQNSLSEFEMLEFKPQSDGVKASTEGLMGLSQYVLYLLLGLAILAFLFGGMNIFWNLLDALQLICYLKYFNVQYPYNIQSYFTLFGFAEFDFLKQYINLEEYISSYLDTPNPSEKFYEEGYSTVFLVNILSVIIVFFTTLMTFLGCKVLFYLLRKIASTLTLDSIDECEQSVFQFFIYRVTRNLELSLMRMTSEIGSGLLRTFMAVAFDYNIAIFLQLKDFHYDNGILLFSSFLGLVAFFAEIIFLYKSFVFMSKPKYVYELQSTLNNYGALYEGLVIQKNPFTYHYNILLLSKKMVFMFFLVFLYDAPCLQVGMVSMLNLVMAAYLQKNKPLEEADEQLKNVGSELFIWVAELFILLLAMNEQSRTLDDDQQTLIGWFVIAFCSLLILYQLVLDVKQHVHFLMKEYKIIQKLVDRFKLFINKQEPDQESNIFLRNQRNMVGNSKKSKSLKMRKVVTFSLSSSNS